MDLGTLSQQGLAFLLTLARLGLWLLLLAALFLPLERLVPLRRERIFRQEFATDLAYYFLSGLVPVVALRDILSVLQPLIHAGLPAALTGAMTHLPAWAHLALILVIGDLGFYWGHRWCHEVPWLWRFHAVHHSPEHVDWLVNTRAHPLDLIFTRLCGLLPLCCFGLDLPLAGRPGGVALLTVLIGTVWGFFVHANIRGRFGPLEWLVATPAFHHWHHSNDGPAFVNKNYAALLPVIDWLFGTLYLPAARRTQRYGIDGPGIPPGLLAQLVYPFTPGSPLPPPHLGANPSATSVSEAGRPPQSPMKKAR